MAFFQHFAFLTFYLSVDDVTQPQLLNGQFVFCWQQTSCHVHLLTNFEMSSLKYIRPVGIRTFLQDNLPGFGNLRTGELVICELIVRTTDANLGYNANQKVRTFYAIKRGPYTCFGITQYRNDLHNDSKRRKKPIQCTFYKNTTKLHVSVAVAIICTILGLCICDA